MTRTARGARCTSSTRCCGSPGGRPLRRWWRGRQPHVREGEQIVPLEGQDRKDRGEMTYFPDFSKIEFVGRLTADPKVNDAGGSPVTKMRVAIGNGSRKGSEQQLPSTFVNVDVWNGQGERCAQYLAK